jgi:hypothetical protein
MKLRTTTIFLVAVLFAALTTGQARAICVTSTDVTSTVTPSGSIFTYDFSVLNGCRINDQPLLADFFLPYFSDAGVSDIVVPDDWSYSIDPSDDLFDLSNAGVIEFESATPLGYSYTSGFSYAADYGGIEGPFAMSLTTDGVSSTLFGDPLIPASPDAVSALGTAAVPEPSTTAPLILGLCIVINSLRRRFYRQHASRSYTTH